MVHVNSHSTNTFQVMVHVMFAESMLWLFMEFTNFQDTTYSKRKDAERVTFSKHQRSFVVARSSIVEAPEAPTTHQSGYFIHCREGGEKNSSLTLLPNMWEKMLCFRQRRERQELNAAWGGRITSARMGLHLYGMLRLLYIHDNATITRTRSDGLRQRNSPAFPWFIFLLDRFSFKKPGPIVRQTADLRRSSCLRVARIWLTSFGEPTVLSALSALGEARRSFPHWRLRRARMVHSVFWSLEFPPCTGDMFPEF